MPSGQSDEELRDLGLEQLELDTGTAMMGMMLPSSEDELYSLLSDPMVQSPQKQDDNLVNGKLAGKNEVTTLMIMMEHASESATQADEKRGCKLSGYKAKDNKIKDKARLRNYERRSRHKREHTMMTMKKTVTDMETCIKKLCQVKQNDNSLAHMISELTMEAICLANHNNNLRKALENHRFFHSMLQLEYNYRETTTDSVAEELFNLDVPFSWRPMDEAVCLRVMRDSVLEIEAFSSSEDFVSSGLEICGWHEKRKLVGNNVNFMFHKKFAKDCSEDLATRSWEMRAVQDQVTRYFGHSLEVKVEVLQRFEDDVVVVRRKIKHTVDGWVHHTIYLLFRTKTPNGHLVCIRDINPEDTDDLHVMSGSATQCVIWSKVFIWWKFTTLPEAEGQQICGFEVEYGGSLGSATQADAAFWIREVLVLALRWENLVVGPLITLG